MDTSKLCFGCFNEHDGNGPCPRCGFDLSKAKHPFVALPIGTILNGRYLTGRVLGVGGFGVTYLAFDMTLEISVAVKEFLPSGIALRESDRYTMTVSSPEEQPKFDNGASKFMDEARLLAKLRDVPNIVSVQDYFRENNTAYFVMEYVEGVDLMKYTQMRGGKLSFEEALRLILPVIDSLAHVHAHNLLHRDISPDNIVVTNNGTSRLLDFGAARLAIDTEKSKSIILKHGFAPEEQYRKHGNQGPWSDEYALAATMYLIITGVMPPDAIERVHEDTLASPISLGVEMPQYANDALMKALAVKASDRFPDMKSFSEAITGKVAVTPALSAAESTEGDNDDPNAMVAGKTVAMEEEIPEGSSSEKVLSPSILSEPKYKPTEVRTGVTMPEVKKSIWKKPLTYILAGIILLAGISIPVGIYISQNYEWGEVEVTTKKTKKTKKPTATTSETPSETMPPVVDPDISDDGEVRIYTDNVRGIVVSAPPYYEFSNKDGLFSFTRNDGECVVYTDFFSEMDEMRVASLNDFVAQSKELIEYYLNDVLGYESTEMGSSMTNVTIKNSMAVAFDAYTYKAGRKMDVTFVVLESKEREGVYIQCGLMPLDDYGTYNSDYWNEIESILLSFQEISQKESDYTLFSSPDIFSGSFLFRNNDVESLEPIDILNNRAINLVLKNVKDPNTSLFVISLGNQQSITTACTAAEQAMGSRYKFGGYTSVTPIVRTGDAELRIRNYQLALIDDENVTFQGTTCVINLSGQYFAVVATCGNDKDLEQITLDFTMLVRSLNAN